VSVIVYRNRFAGIDDYTLSHCDYGSAIQKEIGKQTMSVPSASEHLGYFKKQQSKIVETIRQLVEIESPSDVKQSVDRLGTVLASRLADMGGRVHVHPAEKFGNHVQVEFRSAGKNKNQKPVLLLGHLDTVYPIGAISKMPCRVAKGRLYGPGVLDMKSGIALALHVIEAMLKWNAGKLPRPVTLLLVSDEEVGSTTSRTITESLARQSAAVLVIEPAQGLDGAVKTARKGICEYTLKVTGKAAHSGLDFEKGHSAILELARQVGEISRLVDLKRGVTVNVGKVSGGTRVNVVAAEATAAIDVRVRRMGDALRIDRKLRSLKPFNKHCRLAISGGMNRPPMERTAGVAALYAKAAVLANELGWKLPEASVGGGSDGNFTAALGIPTLDGLGGIGEGAHAEHESVVISELPKRAALLAALIAGI
jgi:glutamate carboxypeptidase